MALTFPTYFPEGFLGPVVKAAAKAERQFRSSLKVLPVGDPAPGKPAATKYVQTVTLAFAHQACEAARASDPHVAVSRIDWFVEDFLRRVSVHVYHELGDRGRSRTWGSWETFQREMETAVRDSKGWDKHLAERVALGDALDMLSRKKVGGAGFQASSEAPLPNGSNETAVTGIVEVAKGDARAQVDAFIRSVKNETGQKIKRKEIWRVAGYTEATQFERFQRGKGSSGSIARFSRVLKLEPRLFLERLTHLPKK